jgi:hypothetical protein
MCETWWLTRREEPRLRMFENRVLRGIYVPKREAVIEKWRKVHGEEINELYYSHSVVRVMKWRIIRLEEHVARILA